MILTSLESREKITSSLALKAPMGAWGDKNALTKNVSEKISRILSNLIAIPCRRSLTPNDLDTPEKCFAPL